MIDVALPHRDTALAWRLALVYAASLIAAFGCSYGETVLTALLGQRVMRDLRQQLFDHVQRLSIGFYDRTPVGRLVTRVTSDVESLNELFTAGGHELYLKSASDYVRPGPVTFGVVSEAALRRGEIAVGYRMAATSRDPERAFGVTVNPSKRAELSLTADDKIIVLADN